MTAAGLVCSPRAGGSEMWLIPKTSPTKLGGVSWWRIALVAVLSIVGAAPVRAQAEVEAEALSLEQAIEIATENARAMIHIREDQRRVAAQRDRAVAAYLPSIDVVFTAQERFRNQPIVELRGPVFCNSSLSTYDDCETTNDFVEGPFVDRQQLNDAIRESGAERVFATHGYTSVFRRWLETQGYDAHIVQTDFEGENLDADARDELVSETAATGGNNP